MKIIHICILYIYIYVCVFKLKHVQHHRVVGLMRVRRTGPHEVVATHKHASLVDALAHQCSGNPGKHGKTYWKPRCFT